MGTLLGSAGCPHFSRPPWARLADGLNYPRPSLRDRTGHPRRWHPIPRYGFLVERHNGSFWEVEATELATIRAEIERLEKALKNCADGGLRKWIEAVIEEQKKKLPPPWAEPGGPSIFRHNHPWPPSQTCQLPCPKIEIEIKDRVGQGRSVFASRDGNSMPDTCHCRRSLTTWAV